MKHIRESTKTAKHMHFMVPSTSKYEIYIFKSIYIILNWILYVFSVQPKRIVYKFFIDTIFEQLSFIRFLGIETKIKDSLDFAKLIYNTKVNDYQRQCTGLYTERTIYRQVDELLTLLDNFASHVLQFLPFFLKQWKIIVYWTCRLSYRLPNDLFFTFS